MKISYSKRLLVAMTMTLGILTPSAFASSGKVNVVDPGTLRELINNLSPSRFSHLTISGNLNGKDIAYLVGGTGKMVSVDTLDISAVTLVGDDTPYKQLLTERSDIGFGTTTEIYYLSENDTVIYDGEATGMGGYVGVHHVFCKDLSGAFAECESFKRIIMPKHLDKVGDYQFFHNTTIESVELPVTAESFGLKAFDGVSQIKSLRIPEGIKTIPMRSIRCSSLEDVYIPASVDSICDQAFQGSPLKNVDLHNVKYIGESAFSGNHLSGLLTLSSANYIGGYSFSESSEIESIAFSDQLTEIGNSAFAYCHKISTLDFPPSLKSIGSKAFYNCGNLIAVHIPDGIDQIAGDSFENTPWQNNLKGESGVKYIGTIAIGYDPATAPDGNTFSFKEGTTRIADRIDPWGNVGCFFPIEIQDKLQTIILPQSLVRIGDGAFNGCSKLESVYLPVSLTEIGREAFRGCTKLYDIELPSNLQSIGQLAFMECKSIPSVTLPENITYVYDGAFFRCDGIETFTIKSKDLRCAKLFLPENNWAAENKSIYRVNVAPEVTVLPDYMFEGCKAIEKLVFEDIDYSKLKKIGEDCFRECSRLQISQFPESLDSIGNLAFYRTKGYIGHLDLKNISYVGDCAFEGEYGGSTGLTGLTVSAPNVYLGKASFAFNPQLKEISILSETLESDGSIYSPFIDSSYYYTYAEFDNVVIGSDLNGIPAGFFHNCQIGNLKFDTREESGHGLEFCRYAFESSRIPGQLKLPIGTSALKERCFKSNEFTDISVPGSCKEICEAVFSENYELTSIILDEGLESIGDYVFANCSVLKSLTIPSSCNQIGIGIIGGCTSLESVTFLSEIPPSIAVSVYIKNLGAKSTPIIYVPYESYNLYLEVPALQGYRIEPMKPETILVESVTLTPDVWNGEEGDSFKIEAMVLPENASDQTLLWTTSDDSVATVDQEGNVDVISEGNCVITATAVDSMLISAQCIVMSVAGIDVIFNDDDYFDVYDLNGRLILKYISKAGLQKLSPSVYLLHRDNLIEKIIIR